MRKAPYHFVSLMEVDTNTDVVWRPGEGKVVRERKAEGERPRDENEGAEPHVPLLLAAHR